MREVLWLLVETAGSLIAAACMLRLWMVWLGMSLRDPVGHFVFTFTEWLAGPLRKLVPRRGHFDWPCLLAALIISIALAVVFVLLFAMQMRAPSFGAVVLLAFLWLVRWTLWLVIGALLLQVILSWINPQAPIAPMIHMLTEPLLAPLRKRLPSPGGIDLSALVVIVLAQIILTLLRSLQPF